MGQEWAASTPFLYFTDHKPELGRLVTDGRRNEFSRFAAFQHEATRSRIPDPQDAGTFEASRLIWTERNAPGHAATLLFHRTLLNLRRSDAALAWPSTCDVAAPDVDTVVIRRRAAGAGILVAARLRGAGRVDLEPWAATPADAWTVILTTEDAPYCESREPDPMPPLVDVGPDGWSVQFARPSAVILRTS
jgi:maltooligosyltrehalose trehalohydrolase